MKIGNRIQILKKISIINYLLETASSEFQRQTDKYKISISLFDIASFEKCHKNFTKEYFTFLKYI